MRASTVCEGGAADASRLRKVATSETTIRANVFKYFDSTSASSALHHECQDRIAMNKNDKLEWKAG